MEKTLGKNFRTVFYEYRYRFAKAISMVFISNLLLIGNPFIFRHLISMSEKQHLSSGSIAFSSILPWAFLLIIVAFLAACFKYWMRMEFMRISREKEAEIRLQLFSRIEMQSRFFFDKHGIGELLSRLTSDITAYRDCLGFGIMYPLFFITLVIPGIAALFYISPPLASMSLIPLALIPVTNLAIRRPIYHTSRAVQATLAEMSAMTQETFSGIRIVKGYGIEQEMAQRFKKVCRYFMKISFKLACLQGLVLPLFTLIIRLTTLGLVLFAGFLLFLAQSKLSTADFISFMWIQSYIFFPVLMLSWVLPIYQRGKAAYARMWELCQEPIEVQDNPDSSLIVPDKPSIEFQNATFYYPNSQVPALVNLNLKIEGGSFVGITGRIGAGKSTLFHLINRDYEMPFDELYIASQEIHRYSLKALHHAIVTVEQSSFLFSRSLADNVRFAREEATQKELEMALQFADLHETIMNFPLQYETVVGERGVTLSGGQKQRVAIARTFLVNRAILLLDDIFSAVDAATERRIFAAIRRHFSGKTVLLVTHRVSILEQTDRVIFMAEGRIVEDGTAKELIERNGYYAALVALQEGFVA